MFRWMARRGFTQSKMDDLAFPVRLKIAVPGNGLGETLVQMEIWLRENLGPGNFAQGTADALGVSAHAVHFLEPAHAQRFREAFPDLVLADGTTSLAYTSPVRRSDIPSK